MIAHARNAPPRRNPFADDEMEANPLGDLVTSFKRFLRNLYILVQTRGGPALLGLARVSGAQAVVTVQQMSWKGVFCFPHLLVAVWVVVLLRGERWAFHYKVNRCTWDKWEEWPAHAKPHHLIFVADPQLIDPHSYPGRPWPINPLTITITDNYLRRSYNELQSQLSPDSLFFLGDLFDGGREWKTAHGDFSDAKWTKPHSGDEAEYVKSWLKNYGEDYWLSEYRRFSDIFFNPYEPGGEAGGGRRGQRVVASLPGNHDLGFGSDVKIPVRDRFAVYFGEPNRVDVIGNHSIVSVDTVSLSAGTSDRVPPEQLKEIWAPSREFLENVKTKKLEAISEELRWMRGEDQAWKWDQVIEEADKAAQVTPQVYNTTGVSDFPTILLTHVPLYRLSGTPCGPMREHWPPAKHPKEEHGRIVDPRNAISVTAGYQYQNVLSEDDSVRLIKEVGNVVHVFSGDDHDYCEVVHSEAKGNVREITVKSMSMAMGVPTPGFLMVSLWNPVGGNGESLVEGAETDRLATIQTHLCLLPNQIRTYIAYVYLGLFTTITLVIRAILVPVLNLTPFVPDLDHQQLSLPSYRPKKDDDSPYASAAPPTGYASSGSSRNSPYSSRAKNRTASGRPWTWARAKAEPRIEIGRDKLFGGEGLGAEGWRWREGGKRRRVTVGFVGREVGWGLWRVVWIAGGFWGWLAYRG